MFMQKQILWLCAVALAAGACAAPVKVDKPRDQMTQREKDSAFAVSGLPGAGVAGKAIKMADQGAARQAAIDSLTAEN